jgi:hypothetical protein
MDANVSGECFANKSRARAFSGSISKALEAQRIASVGTFCLNRISAISARQRATRGSATILRDSCAKVRWSATAAS